MYNKDNVLTKAVSPTGTTVQYDYSYDRHTDYVEPNEWYHYGTTLGFPTNQSGFTVTAYDADGTPVPTERAVSITRGTTADISNDNAIHILNMSDTARYVLTFWYRTGNGANGTLTGKLRCTNGTAQDMPSINMDSDGEWHYAELVFTPKAPLYTGANSYVTPSVTWSSDSAAGTLYISGISFASESETVFRAGSMSREHQTYNATVTTVTDSTAPMPSSVVRRYTRAANVGGWVYLTDVGLATTTPRPGEVWEITFSAKTVSGSSGAGFSFCFRECDKDGALTTTNASTATNIAVTDDGAWHTYRAYVTINDNAYDTGKAIVPRFGWASSNAAGTVRVNGLTIRKVGNQWNNALPNLGFAQTDATVVTLKEVDSANSPIAYQKTFSATHNGGSGAYRLNAPLESFPQPDATDKWMLSFWAKTSASGYVYVYKNTVSGIRPPQSISLARDDDWHFYTVPLELDSGMDLSDITLYYSLSPNAQLYLNGVNLVPGTVAFANESGQNSAALKNTTIDTGTTLFNTAIEYDTDANDTAYSRVKHYINQGEAYSYTYDDAGNISKIQNPDGSYVEYTYDSLNQLIREHHSLPLEGKVSPQATDEVSYDTIQYTYDSRGNILSKTYLLTETVDNTEVATEVGSVAYRYNSSTWYDRLVAYNGVTITNDTIGNPTAWHDGSTMSWQHGRQLASYTTGGVATTFTYDDEGIRRSKTTGGIRTEYDIYDGTLRRMSDGTNTLQFIYGNGLSSVIFNGTEYWYVFNAQGDVIGLIDTTGAYVVEYTYDSWGKILSKTGTLADTLGTINPFRYRGYIYDEETGLYYCQSRYYDPEVGRFLNADGYVSTGQGVSGHNMFAYCGNNPVVRVDATGNFFNAIRSIVKSVATQVKKIIVAAANYIHNSKADSDPSTTTQNKRLNDQALSDGTGGNFDYGLYHASWNGCETIAIHNAKVLEGIDSSLSKTMLDCQLSGAMIGFGTFGSNPYAIGRVLTNSGIEYERVSLDEMTQPGTYIISYWSPTEIKPIHTIHTVAIRYDGVRYKTYNYYGHGRLYDHPPDTYASKYICGYYLK